MRLTINDRDAFVRAVMDDVPQVDYLEKYRAYLNKALPPMLPVSVRAVWKDPDTRRLLKDDLCVGEMRYRRGSTYVYVPDCISVTDKGILKASCEAMQEKATVQADARRELRAKVTALIAGCSTLKQAQERLPEFKKYLPAERDATGTTHLPAIANVVADLTKAGWPKGKKGAQAAA